MPADGFHEVAAVAALTGTTGRPLADADLVFLPDDAPPAIVCDQAGTRVWPDHILNDGTPVPANFMGTTLDDGHDRQRAAVESPRRAEAGAARSERRRARYQAARAGADGDAAQSAGRSARATRLETSTPRRPAMRFSDMHASLLGFE